MVVRGAVRGTGHSGRAEWPPLRPVEAPDTISQQLRLAKGRSKREKPSPDVPPPRDGYDI